MKHLLVRIVYTALIGMLAIGSVSQTHLVQAAPANLEPVDIIFELDVYPENLPTICVKQKLDLYINVSKTIRKVIGGKLFELPGTTGLPQVTSSVKGSGKLQTQLGDIDALPISQVHYTFTADKPGTATLKFSAPIENRWIGAKEEVIGSGVRVEKEVTVKVIDCKYKVKTNSKYSEQGITIMSTMDGEMKADEQGNLTGSATVNWIGAPTASGNCSGTIDIASSQADLSGNLDENSQLVAEVTYLPAALTHNFCCQGICATDKALVTPDAVTMFVPSSGGVSTKFHRIYEERNYYSFRGSVDIVVIPVEDEAVSFIPGNQELSWDNLLNLFGVLLALY